MGSGRTFRNKSSNFLQKFVKKLINTFNTESNIRELSKGLCCSFDLLEDRAVELERNVIKTRMISERKLRDFLSCKYGYTEIEQELLLTHMKNNKVIEICKVTIKDDTTDEECDHRAVYCLGTDANQQSNLNLLEVEINLFSLSDAVFEIERMKEEINNKIKEYVDSEQEKMIIEMLKALAYAEELWVNVARSIALIQEQLEFFTELPKKTTDLLIRQSRRDLYFYEKCKRFITAFIDK